MHLQPYNTSQVPHDNEYLMDASGQKFFNCFWSHRCEMVFLTALSISA